MTIINVNSISGINSITAQGASGIEFYDSSGNSVHTVTSDTLTVGTGASVHNPASNVLTLGTNNEERIRIDSSGHVGIGTDAYFARLHIEDSSGELIRAEMTTDTASGRITCIGGTASYAGINFGDRDDIDAGRIRYYNNVDHADYNKMLFYTDNAVQMRIDSDGIRLPGGNGINFADYATSGNPSSNLLDDYEEGTWTPSFTSFTLGNGIITGQYTKIGNIVHVTFRLDCGSTTSWAGNINAITGLPFSNALGSNTGYLTASNPSNNWFGWTQHYSTGTSTNYIQWITSSNIQAVGSNSVPFTWGSSTIMRFNMTYRVG